MPLPPWLGAPVKQNKLRYRPGPIGWVTLGGAHYTCMPPPGWSVDKSLWKRIHEFDPGLIPIWEKQWWLSPDQNAVLSVFMGGARYMTLGRSWKHPMRVDCPPGMREPNLLELVFRHEPDPREGGPGTPMKPDEIYAYLRRNFIKPVDDRRRVKDEEVRIRQAEEDAASESFWKEQEYKRKQVDKSILPKFAQISGVEWGEHRRRMDEIERRKKLGLEYKDKKPFVDLGG